MPATQPIATSPVEANVAKAPPDKPSRGSVLRWVVLAVCLVVAAAYGMHWWSVARFHEETDDAYVGGDLTIVSSKVSGYLADLRVTDNQFVHAGDLLARIDTRDYDAAIDRTHSSIDAQEATLANLKAQASLQQALIARAKAGVDAAQAEASRASDDSLRYADLVKRSAVSVESAQRATATHATAEANVARARADLLATQRQQDVIAAQRQQTLAALEQARAEDRIAKINLGYTDIRAPRDGYVGNRRARAGAYVATGSQLLSIVPASGLWIDANFKEDQLGRMKIGQRVEVRVDAVPGGVLHGRLGSLAPATGAQFSILPPENATGNFTKIVQRVPVRIELDAADGTLGRLRPGLSVVVRVDTADDGSAAATSKTASAL